ncbi:hypothetical protein CLIB1423_09S04808 [[Candida] railenensis]|uniref:Transmembrane protein n=1 Tax=[Candida] railenensis TaxID=45579 RepID=A0A9P0QQS7_9ASCO|nr:hypothetical protein CLIB1423_09S04808 [[Candida] railenensis]
MEHFQRLSWWFPLPPSPLPSSTTSSQSTRFHASLTSCSRTFHALFTHFHHRLGVEPPSPLPKKRWNTLPILFFLYFFFFFFFLFFFFIFFSINSKFSLILHKGVNRKSCRTPNFFVRKCDKKKKNSNFVKNRVP